MRTRRRERGLALLLGGLVAGCASSGLETRIQRLEAELRDLRRSHALTTQRLRQLDRLDQTTYVLQDSIEKLSLEVEGVRRGQSELAQRVDRLELATGIRGGEAQASRKGRVRRAPRSEPRPNQPAVPSQPVPADARGIYQAAYAAMEAGRYEEAIAGFEALLARFPRDDLADNAHYWLGEIAQRLGNLDEAERHFRTILERYPSGNKVPDATYKLGVIAEERGDQEAARTWYRKVQEQFPWSPVAEKAAAKLGQGGS